MDWHAHLPKSQPRRVSIAATISITFEEFPLQRFDKRGDCQPHLFDSDWSQFTIGPRDLNINEQQNM